LFQLVTTVVTDSATEVDIHELKRLRRDESATYAKVLFKGYAESPTLGLVLLGFDIDRNSLWADNEAEIRKITGATEDKIREGGFIKDVAEGDAWAFIRTWTVEMIDMIISMDRNDRVLDWSALIPLSGAPYSSSIKLPLEAKTKNPDEVGADYSVHLMITYSQVPPGFSDARASKVWVPCKTPDTESRRDNWVGRWHSTGGSPESLSVSILITKNKLYTNMLDVSVTELNSKNNDQTVSTSDAVPISRVFVELGFRGSTSRKVESEEPVTIFSQVTEASFASIGGIEVTTERDAPQGPTGSPYFTRFSVETSIASDAVSKFRLSGPDFGLEKIALHEQIGPDFLWLSNQAVLEIYRIIEDGVHTRFGLIYLRPVTNILYREGRTFQLAKTLEHAVL
jgi:hypothetical protein